MSLLDLIKTKNGEKPASKLGMIILSILFSYIITEATIASFRIIDRIQVIKDSANLLNGYKEKHNYFFYRQKPDPELGFVYTIPTKEQRKSEQHLFGDKDELGFRNLLGDKENGKIIILGDSFSYGEGVSISESWSKKLESDLGVRVANLSVNGYNPTQYNLTMKRHRKYLERKIILYGVYINDFTDRFVEIPSDYYEESGRNKFKSPKPSFSNLLALLEKRPFFERTLTYNVYKLFYNSESRNATKINSGLLIRGENEIQKEWLSEENKVKFFKTLEEAKDTAKDYDSTLIVVYFPSRAYIYSKEYIAGFSDKEPIELEEKAKEILSEYVQMLGLPFINTTNTLKEEYQKASPIYLFMDAHFNSHGNEIVAQEIACKLTEWGYVQPTKSITEICKEKPTLNSVVTPGIIHLDEIDF